MTISLYKKGIVLGIIALFLGAGVTPNILTTTVKADLTTGLVGYWSFDEGSGNTAHDTAGYDNAGTIYGAMWTSSGKISVLSIDDEIDQKQQHYCGWGFGITATNKLAQSFTPTMPILTRVQLFCWQNDDSYEGVKISIRSSLYGNDLTTAYKDKLPSRVRWVEFNFDYIEVIPGKEYYIIWEQLGGGESIFVYWGYGGDNPYDDGSAWIHSGGVWQEPTQDKCQDPIDFCFQTYGLSTTDPIAGFSYTPEEPSIGDEITFDASSSFDPNGDIVNYDWVFGDGDTSTGKITTHTYTQWDEYSVSLTVTDNDGKTDSITKAITMIDNTDPIVNIISPEINSLYIFGIKIPFVSTVIIGDIDIIIEATDDETDINFVKLEIGSDSEIFWSEPYEYSWTETKFGKVTIEAIAYDNAGNMASDILEVWKFF